MGNVQSTITTPIPRTFCEEMMTDIRQQLAPLIRQRRQAQITFAHPEERTLNGFPVRLGCKLLLLQSLTDFHLDGYYIVNASDIKHLRSNKFERFFEKALRAEHQMEHVADLKGIALQDWQSALRTIRTTGENIIVEWMDDGELVFFAGQIARLNQKSLSFRQFDAAGKWWPPWPVPYDNIVNIQIRSEYINVFSKHVGGSRRGKQCRIGP